MIEEIVLSYLQKTLGVEVYMEIPEKMPENFVVVEKTGSSVENHIYSATFVVQSYSKSISGAATLNEAVKKAMDNIITLDSVFSSKLNSDYNFTDTSIERNRYQAVYDLVY